MAERDYYAVLGVGRSASADEIKSAYRRLAREHHPDVNKSPDAEKRFAEIQEAYAVLSDAEKRADYDRWGRAGAPRGNPFAGAGQAAGGGFDFSAEGFDDFSSMFETFFGGRQGGRSSTRGEGHAGGTRAKRRPPDVRAELTVSFDEMARGSKRSVRVGERTIEVSVPKAVGDGAKLRVPAGNGSDLILTVRVGEHPVFRRGSRRGDADAARSLDVWLDAPVTLAEATLGATISLPTPLGGRANLTVPAGTESGARLRLKGLGLASPAGVKGDLYAAIKIVPPAPGEVSDELRSALDAMPTGDESVRAKGRWAGAG